MKKFNRILSFLTALVLLLSLAPAASAAMRIDPSGIFYDNKHRSMDYEEAEELLSGLKIMKDDNSSPTTTVNKEEMAGMITRLALADYTQEEITAMYGEDENPFTDVKEGDAWYEAVLWAYANGITAGTSASRTLRKVFPS